MRIIFFADGPWAERALDKMIAKGYEIPLIVLRHHIPDESLREKALKNGISTAIPEKVNDQNFLRELLTHNADIGVSLSFNQIFKKDLIDVFPLGMINCHAGKLPYYRGRNVLNWALINGEKEIGVTCHYIDDKVDTGDIILQKVFPVTQGDDYSSVLDKAYEKCAEVLSESLEFIEQGNVKRIKQQGWGTYCTGREDGDEFINWGWSSEHIFNFVRAITHPGPCSRSWVRVSGNTYNLVVIKKVALAENATSYNCIDGAIIGYSANRNPLVKTGDSYIEVVEYSIPDSNKKQLKIGDRLGLNWDLIYLNHLKG